VTTLTIVVPAHDAGTALTPTVRRAAAVAEALAPGGAAVVVVDDGSTDGSVDALRAAAAAEPGAFAGLEVLVHPQRRGKGAALRTGFAHRPADWSAFCDADGDIDPEVLLGMGALVGLPPGAATPVPDPRPDAVCGSKTPAADLPVLRRVASEVFKLFRRVVLPLGLDDSQTGAKLFAGPPLQEVLPRLHEEGFAFDLEVLAALRADGHGRFVGYGVVPRRVSSSSVTPRAVVQLAVATIRLAVRYRGRRRR
jgi:glycosyltransferase involved in cell wall biosynthesis